MERVASRAGVDATPGIAPCAWRIRRASPEDDAALTALMRQTFLATHGHCSSPANVGLFLDTHCRREIQRREILDRRIDTLLVEERGELLGYAQLRWGAPTPPSMVHGQVELWRMYLRPWGHGTGLGTRLMAAATDASRLRGAREMWLHVWQGAAQAIRFYHRHGFGIVGASVCMVGTDPRNDWVMRHVRVPEGGAAAR